MSGFLLEHFSWGSVFLVTIPLAIVAVILAWRLVPAHVNESTERVDNLGGILSVVLVGALILAINFAPVQNAHEAALILGGVAVLALVLFFVRQRRAANPLYDLQIASRPTFWVAASEPRRGCGQEPSKCRARVHGLHGAKPGAGID